MTFNIILYYVTTKHIFTRKIASKTKFRVSVFYKNLVKVGRKVEGAKNENSVCEICVLYSIDTL